ncbi:MAG: ABC transporter permease [Candidatus Krumholzibacteriota bacterium]|nr:ABC transporter permease [Candidatus Krumholzibacteriota bacterium]
MSKVGAVFLREYLERVRRRSFWIGLLLVPLFMGAVIILPMWLAGVQEDSASTVLVVDETGRYKADFEAAIQDTLAGGAPRYVFLDRGLDAAGLDASRLAEPAYLATLLDGELLDWFIVIPADVATGGEVAFHGRVVSNFTLLEVLESRLTDLLRRERLARLELDPRLLEQIQVHARLRTYQHKGGEASEAGFESLYLSTMVMVMILYMTIIVFGSMIQRSILEDKNQHVTEVVLSSMDATRFFTGKILGIGAVGLTQYLAWLVMALAAALFGLLTAAQFQQLPSLQPATFAYFVAFYVLGFLLYAGLFAAAGAMSTTDQEAQQLQQPLIMLLIVPLVIIIYIFQNPDAPFSTVMSLIPFFAPLVMFMRVNISSPPAWQIVLAFALLIGTIAGAYFVSGRIFRVGILMTGKKASLAEAWRWVRRP